MNDARIPLSFIPTGEKVRLCNLGEELSQLQREQLHAYGLGMDCEIMVLQRHPMPVILADELEIALEPSVARHIWVERFQTATE